MKIKDVLTTPGLTGYYFDDLEAIRHGGVKMDGRYIIPLDLGDHVSDKSSSYLRRGIGEKEAGKRLAMYIGGAEKKIVVDTGAPDLERSLKYHSYSKSEPRKPEQEIEAQLAKAGVKPEEIDIVVLTHLHWDHVGNVTKFPNATFIVSKEELAFAMDPLPCLYLAYEAMQLGMEPEFLKVMDRIKTVDMKENEIVKGVRLISLPGHTPGSIGVVVETEKGPYVIAGDAVPKYGNLKGAPEEHQPYLMSGIYTDMVAMWRSFELIDKVVGHDFSKVIPGHDPMVFQKERYP
jgi:glyoxylase-like metal-dependent hydrolase (beta-lactamase superfamily II)